MITVFLTGDKAFNKNLDDVEQLHQLIKTESRAVGCNYELMADPVKLQEEVEHLERIGVVFLSKTDQLPDWLGEVGQQDELQWLMVISPNTQLAQNENWVRELSFELICTADTELKSSLSYIGKRLKHYLRTEANNRDRIGAALIANLPNAINPLMRGIQKQLEQLADQNLSNEIRQSLDHTMHTLVRSQDLIDELELLRGQEPHKKSSTEHLFSIENVFQRLEQHFQEAQIEGEIDLRFNVEDELPEALKGEESLLHRMLYNLLLNSIEHTGQGHIQCASELISWPDNELRHAWVRFEVADTGSGMSEQTLAKIKRRELFESSPGKLGAGLALVQLMVDQMGGIFEIESQPQVGTRCTIQLPFDLPDEADLKQQEENELAPNLTGANILIVEDNPVNMSVIEQVISETGATIMKAEHGKQAIEIVRSHPQDLIMMDVQMPVMDGLETTEKVLSDYAEWHPNLNPPHIIALTAAAMDGDRERCLEAGMVDYITKPFRAEVVFEKLEYWLEAFKKDGDAVPSTPVQQEDRTSKTKEKTLKARPASKSDSMITSVERLYEYAQGNDVIVANMIDVFLKHTPEYLNLLRQHIENQLWEEVKKQAHKMKPQMGYVGLDRVVILLERIEDEALTRQRTDQAKALLRKVEQLCDRAMEELLIWKEQHESEAEKQP